MEPKKIDYKCEIGDIVKVYEGTFLADSGVVGIVVERNTQDNEYAVASLESYGLMKEQARRGKIAPEEIFIVLMSEHSIWASSNDIEKVEFSRPRLNYLSKLLHVFSFVAGLGIAYYGLA